MFSPNEQVFYLIYFNQFRDKEKLSRFDVNYVSGRCSYSFRVSALSLAWFLDLRTNITCVTRI